MKHCYFTSESIDDKSREMLRKLTPFKKMNRFDYVPEKSALLILDMQKVFLSEKSHAFIPSSLALVMRIRKLAEIFQEIRLPIILTRHVNSEENAGLMMQWWKNLIREEDEFSEIIPELNIPSAVLIQKTQYDGFYQTVLEKVLREKNVCQVVIAGVMTHLCCETTARSAFIRGFQVFFPIDGTATYSEDLHLSTLINLSHGFAVPVLMEELQSTLEAFRGGD